MKNLTASLAMLAAVTGLGSTACGSSDAHAPAHASDTKDTTTPDDAGPVDPTAPKACDGFHTNFPGDENCIAPPPADLGLQLHVGPDDYDNPDALWIMNPGDEKTECYHLTTPNDAGKYYFKQQYRMRPGSHHMIITTSSNPDQPEGWGPCQSSIISSVGGTQHTIEDLPPHGIVPPEDEGLGRGLDAHTPLDLQLHFYNATEGVTLREVWVNLIYKDKADVTTNLGMLGGFTPVSVPPHTQTTVGNVCDIKDAIPAQSTERVVTLFGHAHSHNTRFVVYWDHSNGSTDTVYDNYDWSEAPTYTYDTVVKNPLPDAASRTTGGYSGMLVMQTGDKLRFSCDINNTTDNTLVGTNEVFSGEMCNLFGSVAGLGFPCFQLAQGSAKAPAMP
ncbi:MAG TPA: hypothetical protein VH062_22315 [Polyangiaceae bacterium]|jgi:hypothetical protein|nr:hypothetical protein [Polyangiaceae bacterium]